VSFYLINFIPHNGVT